MFRNISMEKSFFYLPKKKINIFFVFFLLKKNHLIIFVKIKKKSSKKNSRSFDFLKSLKNSNFLSLHPYFMTSTIESVIPKSCFRVTKQTRTHKRLLCHLFIVKQQNFSILNKFYLIFFLLYQNAFKIFFVYNIIFINTNNTKSDNNKKKSSLLI